MERDLPGGQGIIVAARQGIHNYKKKGVRGKEAGRGKRNVHLVKCRKEEGL